MFCGVLFAKCVLFDLFCYVLNADMCPDEFKEHDHCPAFRCLQYVVFRNTTAEWTVGQLLINYFFCWFHAQ